MFRKVILAALVCSFASVQAQDKAKAPEETLRTATQELEAVISDAAKLDDKLAIVIVKARAAALISYSDAAQAEKIFLQLWKLVQEQTADFDKEKAKLTILKHLFPRNPKLARRLAAGQPKPEASAAMPYNDSRLASKLASHLVETDPSVAAALLEGSLGNNPTPGGIAALVHLREKDPLLSDYVAGKALDVLTSQRTPVSLPALHLWSAYVFPGPDVPTFSFEAESSLQALQFRYFLAGYDVLTASLTETNEALLRGHYTQRDLQYRSANQAQVAAILAALAPRLQPSLAAELNAIANRLAPHVPANVAQISKFTLARLSGNRLTSKDPEESFVFSLSNGDFDEARKQLDRVADDKKKEIYTQLLIKNEAKSLLAKSDIIGALSQIRKLADQPARLVMYLEAVKASKKAKAHDLTNIVINEARLLIPQTDRDGLHVRALLHFAAQLTASGTEDDAMEFLNHGVTAINALGKRTNEKSASNSLVGIAMAELNDPNTLLDAPEVDQAFAAAGRLDLDRGLAEARRIELRPVQLVARLETLGSVIKRNAAKRKPPTKSMSVSVTPR